MALASAKRFRLRGTAKRRYGATTAGVAWVVGLTLLNPHLHRWVPEKVQNVGLTFERKVITL